MANDRKEFVVEDATIIFGNFSGKKDKFNSEGNRHFSVVLSPEQAEELTAEGWNVKVLDAREDEEPLIFIRVFVRFDIRPPRITTITSSGRHLLDEDTVAALDSMDISKVDLMVSGYEWELNGKAGIKPYLKTMFVTVDEDILQRKYALIDDRINDDE